MLFSPRVPVSSGGSPPEVTRSCTNAVLVALSSSFRPAPAVANSTPPLLTQPVIA